MDKIDAAEQLRRRLAPRKAGVLDIVSPLRHFALITYAVPVERVAPHIPVDRFDIPTFEIAGKPMALLSVVPFIDFGFRFRLFPIVRFHFAQTNYRVYVTNREAGQPSVWFFGTTLGGWPVHFARFLWKIPWYHAKYSWRCDFDANARRYETFRYRAHSDWGEARIEITDTGEPAGLLPGFTSVEEMTLVLTHPVDGFFYRTDGDVGTYSVSHEVLQLTRGEPNDLYFGLLDRLGVLTAEEMRTPHSVLVCPETNFHIYMPPKRLTPR